MPSKTVGKLAVVLSVNSSKFRKGMQRASSSVKTFGSKLGVVKKILGAFSGQLMAVASVAGFAAFVKSSASAYDALGKLSDRIGANVEELQRLQHAADITGAGSDRLVAGLQTLAKRLGEAARGTGEARIALQELGLDAEKLAAMSPDQAFYKIADAMKNIEGPGKRAAIAANLFGKANMELLSTLDQGSEGLRRLGLELDNVMSREEIRKIEEFNDQMTRLKNNLRPIGGWAAGKLSDMIAGAALAKELLTKGVTDKVRFDALNLALRMHGAPKFTPRKPLPDLWSRGKMGVAGLQPSLDALRNTFAASAALFANRLKTEWDYFTASGMQPPWGGQQKAGFSLTGAYERGSAGAYSIIANTQGTLLQEAKRRRRILEQIRDKQEDQEVVEIAP